MSLKRVRFVAIGGGILVVLLCISFVIFAVSQLKSPSHQVRTDESRVVPTPSSVREDRSSRNESAQSGERRVPFVMGDRIVWRDDQQGWWVAVPSSTVDFEISDVTARVTMERARVGLPPIMHAIQVSHLTEYGKADCTSVLLSMNGAPTSSEQLMLETMNDRISLWTAQPAVCGATLLIQPNKTLSYIVAKKPYTDPDGYYEPEAGSYAVPKNGCVDYALFEKKGDTLKLLLPSIVHQVSEGPVLTEGGCDASFPVFLTRVGMTHWIGVSFNVWHELDAPHFLFDEQTYQVKRLNKDFGLGNQTTRDGRYWAAVIDTASMNIDNHERLVVYDVLLDKVVAHKDLPKTRTTVKIPDMFTVYFPMEWIGARTIRYQTADREAMMRQLDRPTLDLRTDNWSF